MASKGGLNMRFSKELEQWAMSHSTTKEIASVIERMSGEVCTAIDYSDDDGNHNNPIMQRLWEDTSYIEQRKIIYLAWKMADPERDELFWGQDTIHRPSISETIFPETVFYTPDNWGRERFFMEENAIESFLISMVEWEDASIDDCLQCDLVQQIDWNLAQYEGYDGRTFFLEWHEDRRAFMAISE
jgi:hypothetical protein